MLRLRFLFVAFILALTACGSDPVNGGPDDPASTDPTDQTDSTDPGEAVDPADPANLAYPEDP